jgi:hypothetical protein
MRKMLLAGAIVTSALPIFGMSSQALAQSFDPDNGTGNLVAMPQPQGPAYEAFAEALPGSVYGYGAYAYPRYAPTSYGRAVPGVEQTYPMTISTPAFGRH